MKYSNPIYGLSSVLALLLWCVPVAAQKKYEREYSIKGSQIHPDALSFVNECFKNVKIQWYGEESLTGTTIEAKLKSSGKQYSIEFSNSGEIHDIEILTSFNSLPEQPRNFMLKQLKEAFKKFKIMKTQIQWSGSRDLLKAALKEDNLPAGIVIKYELIFRAKKTGLSTYYEALGDQGGKLISIREIIQRNADNLIY